MARCAVFSIQAAPPYSLLPTIDRDLVSGLLATNAVAQCRIHEKDERQSGENSSPHQDATGLAFAVALKCDANDAVQQNK
jgi:hypothetical protein